MDSDDPAPSVPMEPTMADAPAAEAADTHDDGMDVAIVRDSKTWVETTTKVLTAADNELRDSQLLQHMGSEAHR